MRCTLVVVASIVLFCINAACGQSLPPPSDDLTISPESLKLVAKPGPTETPAILSCVYKPSAGQVISWGVLVNGQPNFIFINRTETNIYYSKDTHSLIFYPVMPSHSGKYYCTVSLTQDVSQDQYSSPVELIVFEAPNIVRKDADRHYNLLVRTQVTLNFTTVGKPSPELTLFKKINGEFREYNSPRFFVTFVGIKISPVEPEDVGEYRLNALSEGERDDDDFQISVIIPPVAPTVVISVLEGDVQNGNANDTAVPVLIGSDVVIACDMIEAYTANLVVSWANIPRNNPRITTTEETVSRELMMIENIQKSDANDYICFAANNISDVSKPITIKVGSLPDPYIIMVEFSDNSLSVSWILNSTTTNPEPVINVFVAYTQVNGTSPGTGMQTIAPSVSKTVIRDLPINHLYKVQVWSSNAFGNSTPSEELLIVTAGPGETSTSFTKSTDNSGAVIGAAVGVCVVVVILSSAVMIVVVFVYLHTKRTQAQQQWTKDPEFQSQVSLSEHQFARLPTAPSESITTPAPGPTYALPVIGNGFSNGIANGMSSSSISKRNSEDENTWQVPRDNIQLSELLAEGEHTVLYRATVYGIGKFKKATEVTVKQVKDNNSSPEEVKVLIEEMDLMSDLGIHPNVVNVLAVCTVGDPVYLIMDYFAHGDLLGFLRATRGHTDHYTVSAGTETKTPACTVQSQDLLNLATQIASGMSFLEERKVSHRSLCARNVLVGTGLQVKIYNYGQKNDDQGSYAKWMAPETLFDGTANTTSDVWSFGVTLWEIVSIGGSPYFQMRPEDMRKVLEEGYRMPNPDHCSEEIYKIMQDCWEYDPQDRPSFDLINYRLETLSKSKLSYIDLKLYDEVLYSQFEDTPQLCTAL